MAINKCKISVQYSIIVMVWVSPRHDTVDPMLLTFIREPYINAIHEEVLSLQPMIPPTKTF